MQVAPKYTRGGRGNMRIREMGTIFIDEAGNRIAQTLCEICHKPSGTRICTDCLLLGHRIKITESDMTLEGGKTDISAWEKQPSY
jgi:hypothetical protein